MLMLLLMFVSILCLRYKRSPMGLKNINITIALFRYNSISNFFLYFAIFYFVLQQRSFLQTVIEKKT